MLLYLRLHLLLLNMKAGTVCYFLFGYLILEPATTLKHQMWRLYLGKQLNVFINVATYFAVAQRHPILSGLPIEYRTDIYACGAEAAGVSLFNLVLTEFFVSKLVAIMSFGLPYLYRR